MISVKYNWLMYTCNRRLMTYCHVFCVLKQECTNVRSLIALATKFSRWRVNISRIVLAVFFPDLNKCV